MKKLVLSIIALSLCFACSSGKDIEQQNKENYKNVAKKCSVMESRGALYLAKDETNELIDYFGYDIVKEENKIISTKSTNSLRYGNIVTYKITNKKNQVKYLRYEESEKHILLLDDIIKT